MHHYTDTLRYVSTLADQISRYSRTTIMNDVMIDAFHGRPAGR